MTRRSTPEPTEHGPAKAPCISCPYRQDVPSGVWHEEEYDKLPEYDKATGDQPIGAFFCHQQNNRLCAGWVGCHDMQENLSLRMAVMMGYLDGEDANAAIEYNRLGSPVPLWSSGAEAAARGRAEIEAPSPQAERVIVRLTKKLARKEKP